MESLEWNIPKFKELCHSANISYPRDYVKSLLKKKRFIDYHAEMSTKVWEDLFQAYNGKSLSPNDEKWIEAEVKSEANAIALMYHLHSLADIMAQIINRVVIDNQLRERDVGIYTVKKKIEKEDDKNKKRLLKRIEELLNNMHFKYVSAFVNITKHRYMIDTKYWMELKKGNYTQGLRFKKFNYNGIYYPKTWIKEIATTFREGILNCIINIGVELNKYIEKVYLGGK